MPRIGPKMSQAAEYVRTRPGCAILPVARHIAPYGTGIQYGYAAVHRAIRAGLILARRLPSGRYSLALPAA